MSSKLADENAKSWVVLKEAYSCLWLSPACSKIAQTSYSIKVGKTRLLSLVQLRAQEEAFNRLLSEWAMIRNCWGSLHWDDWSRCYYTSERYCTACKCCLSIFTKIKFLIIMYRSIPKPSMPPPGKPPGIWLFWKTLVKFPTMLPV